jgi:hypothetical protein
MSVLAESVAFEYFRDPPEVFNGWYYIVLRSVEAIDGYHCSIEDVFVPVYKYPNLDQPYLMKFHERRYARYNVHVDEDEYHRCEICKERGTQWEHISKVLLRAGGYD